MNFGHRFHVKIHNFVQFLSPNLRGDSPDIRGDSPDIRGDSPKIRGTSPNIRGHPLTSRKTTSPHIVTSMQKGAKWEQAEGG